MGANSVTSQQSGSVTGFSTSETAADVQPNKVKRNGFELVMSRIAKGVKGIKKFFQKHASQGSRSAASASPAASSAKRLSVDNTAKAFPEQYRQKCLQYLEEAAQERYALPGSEQFGELPETFTEYFNEVFSKEFQEPAAPFLLQLELNQTELQTQLIIRNELLANQDGGEIGQEIDRYMHFLSLNNALAFEWEPVFPAMDTPDAGNEDAAQALPRPPAVELAATRAHALPAASENPLADWKPGMDLMSTPVRDIAAPLAMPEQTPGDIIDRVYRTNVIARQMLITANIGDTKDSRISFETFSLRLDEIYLSAFKNQFEDFRLQNFSVSEAANMAAETAFLTTALMLTDEIAEAGDQVGIQYVKDMFSKENEVKTLAARLLDAPGKQVTEEAQSAHNAAAGILADSPFDRATQGPPMGDSIVDIIPGKVEPEPVIARAAENAKRAPETAATRRAPSRKLNTAGNFVCSVFKRARKSCVGTADFKQVSMSYDAIFQANFNACLEEEQLKFSEMGIEAKKKLPTTWALRAALGAAKKATKAVTNLMKDSNDADEKAYAKKFLSVNQAFSAKVRELLRPSKPRQTRDVRVAPQKTSA